MRKQSRDTARNVVAFAGALERRPRRRIEIDPAEAGRILFFTGVRYERMAPILVPPADAVPSPDHA